MPSRHLRVLGLLAAVLVALITSCGGSPEPKKPPVPALPAGAALLADSSKAMRTVETAKFSIDVQGDVKSIPFKDAKGQLSRQGLAKGTAMIEYGQIVRVESGQVAGESEQVIEVQFVITDDALYLRGPTSGFQKLPASAAGLVFDPKDILNPDQGISNVLMTGRKAKTEAREQIGGVDTYRVRVEFPAGSLDRFVPGLTQQTNGLVWIAAQGSRLVQAQFPAQGGTVLVQLSDFDSPADIRAPS